MKNYLLGCALAVLAVGTTVAAVVDCSTLPDIDLTSLECAQFRGKAPFVIGTHGSNSVGLFSSFFGLLSNLQWWEKNARSKGTPVVAYWGKNCCYWQPEGYMDVPKGDGAENNAFHYYFEPIVKNWKYVGGAPRNSYKAPDGSCIIAPCTYQASTSTPEFRKRMYGLIQRYVKPKQYILEEVEAFFQEYMANKVVIALHIRSTDKTKFRGQTGPMALIHEARRVAQLYGEENCVYFIATDSEEMLELAKKHLVKVISYNSFRSTNNKPIHLTAKTDKAEHGKEVLMEVLLMARCQYFVHSTVSNVASAVLCFNPDMQHTWIQTEETRQDIKPAWSHAPTKKKK